MSVVWGWGSSLGENRQAVLQAGKGSVGVGGWGGKVCGGSAGRWGRWVCVAGGRQVGKGQCVGGVCAGRRFLGCVCGGKKGKGKNVCVCVQACL